MKLRIVTIGKPKLHYAQEGWEEYLPRLSRFHKVSVSQLADKYTGDAARILEAATGYKVALVINGATMSSPQLAGFLRERELAAQEVSFIIGGPEGLPSAVIEACDYRWSFGPLTFPHDLAMIILLETLYRASTINAGMPYHK
ncbi:MAG TPA: 23S rRNA (pseudouridine(1915)-N(3))-methyltransferase RlmH [Candidatus Saccharimonadales bacterium]|nr:23S rRNA (pseudouridine(1915)-N(3))-methyltransferase RlmH [Candidatus Saccharimonadales bacterium]